MRFDLKVPFAEKDAAKKLGARWDAARKLWYVADGKDPAAFAKWSPVPHEAGAAAPAASPASRATSSRSVVETSGKPIVGSRYVEVSVSCECPPWEVCEQCRALGFQAPA